MLCACVACSLGEASLSCHAGPFKHDTRHTSRLWVARNSNWWYRLSLRTCLYSHMLSVYLRHYDGFQRALVVTSPTTSLGAVRGDVARLPRVALGTVSGGILHVFTGIACLWTLVMFGEILSKPGHLVVIYASTFIEIRRCFESGGRIGFRSRGSTKPIGIYIFVNVSVCRLP